MIFDNFVNSNIYHDSQNISCQGNNRSYHSNFFLKENKQEGEDATYYPYRYQHYCNTSGRDKLLILTVSILDHSISNVRSFKYLGIHISSDFTWTDHIEHLTGKINQRLGLLKRIKHLLPFRARLLFYKSLVMPLFEYADLVWGDKHNITLMSSLQVFQNKAAKVILNRPLYSSSTEALAVLKWLPLEKRRFQRRCVHVYKCINGLINHDMDLIRQDVLHRHNTRNKGNFRLPRVKRNWGK